MSKKKDKEKKVKEAESVVASDNGAAPPAAEPKVSVSDKKISTKDYEEQMRMLQIELVKLQDVKKPRRRNSGPSAMITMSSKAP